MESVTRRLSPAEWTLVGPYDGADSMRAVPIATTPFVIGRRPDLTLTLESETVSSVHAKLVVADGIVVLHDLGSTNGTYVNGERLSAPAELREGDWVQFSSDVFRVQRVPKPRKAGLTDTVHEEVEDRSRVLMAFDGFMATRAVAPHAQPIVAMGDRRVEALEVLARSHTPGLQSAYEMFDVAAQLGREVELSVMLRREGLRAAEALVEPTHLFLNTHPRELAAGDLLGTLVSVHQRFPRHRLTLEIHEAAVTDVTRLTQLRAGLREHGIGLAYDDFGAGQARLAELTQCPPDFVKFDMSLIRGIDQASGPRQHALATLVRMASELGIVTLAEGVSNDGEDATCRQLGFNLGQGYLYGRPAPIRASSGRRVR